MFKFIIKKIMQIVLIGFIYAMIGFLIAFIILKNTGCNLQDIITIEGILVVILGLMSMMEGNPTGISLQGLGSKAGQFQSQVLLETLKFEREKTPYYKNFLKNSIVQLSFSGAAIIAGGILILLSGIILFG